MYTSIVWVIWSYRTWTVIVWTNERYGFIVDIELYGETAVHHSVVYVERYYSIPLDVTERAIIDLCNNDLKLNLKSSDIEIAYRMKVSSACFFWNFTANTRTFRFTEGEKCQVRSTSASQTAKGHQGIHLWKSVKSCFRALLRST